MAVLAGAVAGAVIALGVASGSASTGSSTTTVVEPAGGQQMPTAPAGPRALSVNQIYRQDSPGVVDVVATSQVRVPGFSFPSFPNIPNFPNIPGFPRVPGFPNLPGFGDGFRVPPTIQRSQGEGAGVVYDTRGDVLTDEHVVAHARSLIVSFQNGRRVAARVVGMDPSTDVAVLHVDVPASSLRPIPFADSSAAQVGDPVVAIGSPFGLPETTTSGIVSAVGRSIPAPDGFTITGAIQTDAPITPATQAARCSTATDGCSGWRIRSPPTPARVRASALPSRPTPSRASRTRSSRDGRSGTRTWALGSIPAPPAAHRSLR